MKRIILFDSECLLCSRSVQFIIKRDPQKKYKFASLKSEIGKKILLEHQIPDGIESIILIEGNQFFIKSTAILKVVRNLHHYWKCVSIFTFIPINLRDYFYDFIANNRYKWFGQSSQCQLLDKDRIL